MFKSTKENFPHPQTSPKTSSSPLPTHLSYQPVLLLPGSPWAPTLRYLGTGLVLLYPLLLCVQAFHSCGRPHQPASRIEITSSSTEFPFWAPFNDSFREKLPTLLSLPFTLIQVCSCSSVNHVPKLPQFHLRVVKFNGHVLSFSNFQNCWLAPDSQAHGSSHQLLRCHTHLW